MIDWKQIDNKIHWLHQHPLISGQSLTCIEDLLVFMDHHVYAVWDFMCLAKSLQALISAPINGVWVPKYSPTVRRWINEIILGEESDLDVYNKANSHYEIYLESIRELGGSTTNHEKWIKCVQEYGFREALRTADYVPIPSRKFMSHTFDIIDTQKTHVLASSLCFGREVILAEQFQNILEQLDERKIKCDNFKFYLERHIHIDGNEHGPASKKLVEELVEDDEVKGQEVTAAAISSINARLEFWNGVSNSWDLQ